MEEKQPNELQEESLIQLQLLRKQDQNKTLVVLPSGGGKTYVPIFDFKNNYHDERLLFITHRNELVLQTVEYFKDVLGDNIDIGIFNSSRKDKDAQIVIATIQTLSRHNNFYNFKPNEFQYLVIDEFHHVAAKTYQQVLDYFEPEFMLGLTATPYRFDGRDILASCGNNVAHEVDLREGIERGFLVPFIYYGLWDDIDYSNIEWNGYKYTEEDLNKVLLIDKRDEAIIREFKDKVKNRKAIGFCCSIKHVRRSIEKFTDAGISCAGVTYKEKKYERDQIIDDFKKGKFQVMFTRDIFNEGVNFPDVEAILLLRPTESQVVFLQQIGRGLRLSKGKANVLILDFIGNYKNAFKIREWLGRKEDTGKGREKKPEYKYPLRCEVHFDKEVVDLFKKQEELFFRYPISNQKLIDEYFRIKELLGHQPTMVEFRKYSHYPVKLVEKHFGSWNNFLAIIKEPIICHHNTEKEELVNEYFRIKRLLGHGPTRREFIQYSNYSRKPINRLFITWNNFLKYLNEPLQQVFNLTKEEIIENYFTIKEQLRRQPTEYEFIKYSKGVDKRTISKLFGSYPKFLTEIGEPPTPRLRILNEDIEKEYKRIKEMLGRVPSIKEFDKYSKYSIGLIYNRYDSWSKFVNLMGDKPRSMPHSKEYLIQRYIKLRAKKGEKLVCRDLGKGIGISKDSYKRNWGSWKKAVEEIEKIIAEKEEE